MEIEFDLRQTKPVAVVDRIFLLIVRDPYAVDIGPVLGIVEDIVRNKHKTVCMITHNPEIAKMADRVIKLKNGMISSVRVNMNPVKAVELSW